MRPALIALRQVSAGVLAQAVASLVVPATAAVCPVPSEVHPTLRTAATDPSCTAIQLAAGTFPENVTIARDLQVVGAGSGTSIVAGAMTASGAGTDLTLEGLAIDGTAAGVAGCWPSVLWATDGARVDSSSDVVVANSGILNGGCRLFADGFESGGLLAWSVHQP